MAAARRAVSRLTSRQRQVLRAFIDHGQKGAAAELGISEDTVKHTLATIRSKLGVATSAQAAIREFDLKEWPI